MTTRKDKTQESLCMTRRAFLFRSSAAVVGTVVLPHIPGWRARRLRHK